MPTEDKTVQTILDALPNTDFLTVARAAARLGLPELHVTCRQFGNRQKEMCREINEIEAHPDFQRAEFLADPKQGEISRIIAEKSRVRLEVSRRIRAYNRHPNFSELKNRKWFGLAWSIPPFLVGVAIMTLGGYAQVYEAPGAAMIFGSVGLVPIMIALLLPHLIRHSEAKRIAQEFSSKNFRECLLEYDRLNLSLRRLGEEIMALRTRELRIQSMAARHRTISAALKDQEQTCLQALHDTAFAALGLTPPEDDFVELDEDEIEVEVDMVSPDEIKIELADCDAKSPLGTVIWLRPNEREISSRRAGQSANREAENTDASAACGS